MLISSFSPVSIQQSQRRRFPPGQLEQQQTIAALRENALSYFRMSKLFSIARELCSRSLSLQPQQSSLAMSSVALWLSKAKNKKDSTSIFENALKLADLIEGKEERNEALFSIANDMLLAGFTDRFCAIINGTDAALLPAPSGISAYQRKTSSYWLQSLQEAIYSQHEAMQEECTLANFLSLDARGKCLLGEAAISYSRGEARYGLYSSLAQARFSLGNKNGAQDLLQGAYEEALEEADPAKRAKFTAQIGLGYSSIGLVHGTENAEGCFLASLEAASQFGPAKERALLLSSIAQKMKGASLVRLSHETFSSALNALSNLPLEERAIALSRIALDMFSAGFANRSRAAFSLSLSSARSCPQGSARALALCEAASNLAACGHLRLSHEAFSQSFWELEKLSANGKGAAIVHMVQSIGKCACEIGAREPTREEKQQLVAAFSTHPSTLRALGGIMSVQEIEEAEKVSPGSQNHLYAGFKSSAMGAP